MFEINNLKFKNILDIKQLTIDKQVTCVVGPSGSGKSTLLKLLNGLILPDEANIKYNGIDIINMNGIELRRRVVMLSQTPIIYDGIIEDNLQIGLEFLSNRNYACNFRMYNYYCSTFCYFRI
ncbi:ATP-binding cassette domain-containing protein [Anaerovorax odorimutans]|uniref:ATP-binding cassette domain-containing protein n=1 Tax=Anaerovorax odorimutans TaxID=109327 RepID=UPI00040CA47C|nr:ATP-binding cassette domain-containing protein [Anaerovorax odorimutans]